MVASHKYTNRTFQGVHRCTHTSLKSPEHHGHTHRYRQPLYWKESRMESATPPSSQGDPASPGTSLSESQFPHLSNGNNNPEPFGLCGYGEAQGRIRMRRAEDRRALWNSRAPERGGPPALTSPFCLSENTPRLPPRPRVVEGRRASSPRTPARLARVKWQLPGGAELSSLG